MTLDEAKQLKVGDWVQYKGWQNWRIQCKNKTLFTLVREDDCKNKLMLIQELVNEDYQIIKQQQQVYDQGQDPWTTHAAMETKTCTHQWQQYVGLNETFEFCTICDAKRGDSAVT